MRRVHHHLLPAFALAACAWFASSARAQEGKVDGVRPEVHFGIGWHGGIGFGAAAEFAVLPEGFLPGVDDEFTLRPGGELMFDDDDDRVRLGDDDDDDLFIAAVFTPQWNFYFAQTWSAFAEVGIGLVFGDRGRGDNDDVDAVFVVALGARYHFSRRMAFVLRLNYPFGVQLGLTF
jgi:hypothetical protein